MSDIIPNLENMTDAEKKAVLDAIQVSIAKSKEVQKQRIGENVGLVVDALKKIESDIRSRFDEVGNTIEKRVATIKDGRDGINGKDGRNGKDGLNGKQGVQGVKGQDGINGRDGVDGIDGISVTSARIDFDGSLVIGLSSGIEINVGEVVSQDIAEKIQVISTMSTNGAIAVKEEGTTLTSGVKSINFVGTGITATTSGDDVTVTVAGGGSGTVTSVAATAGTGISITGSPITTSGTLNITNTAPDQTVALTQGGTTTITGTYPNFTISSADQFQGTVTSVTGTSPVASSGGATPAISLASGYGDTLNPYASKTANFVLAAPNGSAGVPTFRAVVAADIPTLNQNTSGSAASLSATLAIASGGTGQTTANTAFNALAPSQTSNSGKYLTTDGTNTSWGTVSAGSGTVTSVAATVPSFLSITGSPVTTSGTLAISYSGTALPIANGGTNSTATPTSGGVGYGTGTAHAYSSAGTTGQVLTSNGSSAPTWATASSDTVGFKNRIINGAMQIDQRLRGASQTPTAQNLYNIDRWYTTGGGAGLSFTVQQNQGSITPPPGFTNYLGITSTAANTPGSGTLNGRFIQPIEGFNTSDLAWGTANAQPVTLSFWVQSSLTGQFAVSPAMSGGDPQYGGIYTINSANTWEYKTIVIPGPTIGSGWNEGTNSNGVAFNFWLLAGSQLVSNCANTWSTGLYGGINMPTGSVNLLATNGATWKITGVQLEKGSTATSFDYRPYGTELALCQRYYWKQTGEFGVNSLGAGFCNATTKARINIQNPVQMRTAPTYSYSGTLLLLNAVASGVTVTSLSSTQAGLLSSMIEFTASGGGLVGGDGTLVLADNATSNFIQASAEL